MTKIGYTVRAFLKKSGCVMIRVRWDKKRCSVDLGTGIMADERKRDKAQQRAVVNSTHKVGSCVSSARQINKAINDYEDIVSDIFARYSLSDHIPSADEFKSEWKVKTAPTTETTRDSTEPETVRPDSLKELMNDYFADRGFHLGKRSQYRYTQAVTHAYDLDKHVKVSNIDRKFMIRLEQWYVNNGYRNNTTYAQMKGLKTLLRFGSKSGYQVNKDALDLRKEILTPPKRVIFLHYDELQTLLNYSYPEEKDALEKYRDMFCFMCMTGLRYSDMIALTKAALLDDGFLELYTEKTDEYLKIPILPQVKAIIDKYSTSDREIYSP